MLKGKEILDLFWHTAVLYLIAFTVFRFMGKRSLANLAPFDLVVIIMIGEAAAIPIAEENVPILRGVIPVVILGGLQILISLLALWSRPFERMAQGTSTLLVKSGTILHRNLKKERLTVADLVMSLRDKDVSSLDEVEEAWLEPKGKITVIKKKEHQSLTPRDLGQLTVTTMDLLLEQNRRRLENQARQLLEQYRARHRGRDESRGR